MTHVVVIEKANLDPRCGVSQREAPHPSGAPCRAAPHSQRVEG
ncbi:MAG: hypothetical protein ACOY3Y_19690 [Acidobacteriota bacterium]